VQGRWKINALMKPIFPYPTMSEIHRRAAGNYLSPKLFNQKVRGILRTFFRFRGGT
jgi:hypothetical protein